MEIHKSRREIVDIFENLKKYGYEVNNVMEKTLNELISKGYYTYNSFDTTEIDNHIIKMLDINRDDDIAMDEINTILREIKTKCEYEIVIGFIANLKLWLKHVRHEGSGADASNAKQQFEKAIARILKDLAILQDLNYAVSVSDMEKRISNIHFNRPRYDVLTKNTALKLRKKSLVTDLITVCGAGKQRASRIKNILDKLSTSAYKNLM